MSEETENNIPDLSEKVMGQIKSQHIRMHSRLYFVLGSVLMGLGLAGVLITAMFFVAVVSFRLRAYGPFEYLWFGRMGLRPFFVTFPWISLLVGIIGIVGGVLLLKRYDFTYKKSFIGISIVLVVLVLSLGLFLDQVAFDERFHKESIGGRLLHQSKQLSGDNWVIGAIIVLGEKEMIILGPDSKEIQAIWDNDALLPFGGQFEVGQKVKLIGEWRDGIFVAKGIGRGKMQWRGMGNGSPQVRGRMMLPSQRHHY